MALLHHAATLAFFVPSNIYLRSSKSHYKFSKEEAIAFGDGENDMDMLLSVGKGIAKGNAAEKVKEIAADICESVTDDGIYYYLKSQKLINE